MSAQGWGGLLEGFIKGREAKKARETEQSQAAMGLFSHFTDRGYTPDQATDLANQILKAHHKRNEPFQLPKTGIEPPESDTEKTSKYTLLEHLIQAKANLAATLTTKNYTQSEIADVLAPMDDQITQARNSLSGVSTGTSSAKPAAPSAPVSSPGSLSSLPSPQATGMAPAVPSASPTPPLGVGAGYDPSAGMNAPSVDDSFTAPPSTDGNALTPAPEHPLMKALREQLFPSPMNSSASPAPGTGSPITQLTTTRTPMATAPSSTPSVPAAPPVAAPVPSPDSAPSMSAPPASYAYLPANPPPAGMRYPAFIAGQWQSSTPDISAKNLEAIQLQMAENARNRYTQDQTNDRSGREILGRATEGNLGRKSAAELEHDREIAALGVQANTQRFQAEQNHYQRQATRDVAGQGQAGADRRAALTAATSRANESDSQQGSNYRATLRESNPKNQALTTPEGLLLDKKTGLTAAQDATRRAYLEQIAKATSRLDQNAGRKPRAGTGSYDPSPDSNVITSVTARLKALLAMGEEQIRQAGSRSSGLHTLPPGAKPGALPVSPGAPDATQGPVSPAALSLPSNWHNPRLAKPASRPLPASKKKGATAFSSFY